MDEHVKSKLDVAIHISKELEEFFNALENSDVDKRWLAIAKTDIQKGFMSLVRSITKPEVF